MGIFDRVHFEADPGFEGFPGDVTEARWQTKSFAQPALEDYRVDEDGRLWYEEVSFSESDEWADVTPEDVETMDQDDLPSFPIYERESEEWVEADVGNKTIEVTTIYEGDRYRYELVFRDDRLVDVARVTGL